MQLSHYIKVYPHENTPGQLLVYSTKKASISLIPEKLLSSFENGSLSPENEALLLKLGVLVPNKEYEKRDMSLMLDTLNAKDRCVNVSVIMNLACNFNCVYCYEGNLKGSYFMSGDKAGLLINFIKERFSEKKNLINLDFYGGEPLLSLGLIKDISKELQSFTAGKGASYTFSLVTNGSLFNRTVAEDLVKVGLTAVRITIDGDAETHNKYRPFKTGAGSFDAIIGNIKETYDLVKMGIGGNFDKVTYERFPLLLDYFEKEGLTPDKIYEVRFGPVSKRLEEDTAPADYSDWCLSVNEPWVMKASEMLRGEILRRGYKTTKIMPMPCHVEFNDAYVVNFDGLLYKCPALVGRKSFEIGNLQDGVNDYQDAYRLGLWKNRECLDCEYLPLCFGGCRYMAYARDGNLDTPDCKKPFLDACLETLIKQDVKYRKPGKTEKPSSV